MNLLLLSPDEVRPDGTARVTGRRLRHAREVLRAQSGDMLRVGLREGGVGEARVVALTEAELCLEVRWTAGPPTRPRLDLVLALPRPKALKRLLPALASLGVDGIYLVNAARVERSYFSSHVLEPDSVERLFALGLEQGRDTVAPVLHVRERLKPFVEDELDSLVPAGATRLVAHPGAPSGQATADAPRQCLAVGPEGGWVDFELQLLARAGFRTWSVGTRPMRVEVAVPYLLGAIEASRLG